MFTEENEVIEEFNSFSRSISGDVMSSRSYHNSNSKSIHSQQPSLQAVSPQPLTLQEQQHRATVELLRSISAVMTKKKKAEWLQALSKEWRIQTQPSDDTNTDAILDRLATKLAPIIVKHQELHVQSRVMAASASTQVVDPPLNYINPSQIGSTSFINLLPVNPSAGSMVGLRAP